MTNYYFITLCILDFTSLLLSRNVSSPKDMKDQVVSGLFHFLTTVYTFSYLNHDGYFKLKGVFCSILFTHSKAKTMPVFGATWTDLTVILESIGSG